MTQRCILLLGSNFTSPAAAKLGPRSLFEAPTVAGLEADLAAELAKEFIKEYEKSLVKQDVSAQLDAAADEAELLIK